MTAKQHLKGKLLLKRSLSVDTIALKKDDAENRKGGATGKGSGIGGVTGSGSGIGGVTGSGSGIVGGVNVAIGTGNSAC